MQKTCDAPGEDATSPALFRKEVVAARRPDRLGTILIAGSPSRWLSTLLATSFALALILFLTLGRYTRRETVGGQLVPDTGLLNVAAPVEGIIDRLLVHEGQAVKAGDLLLELVNRQDSVLLGDTRDLIGRQLETKRSHLRADLHNQQLLAERQTAALKGKLALLHEQLIELAGHMAIVKERSDAAQSMLDRMRPLERRGYVSALQMQQQQAVVFDGLSQYKALARQRLDTRQQLDDAGQQLMRVPLDTAARHGDTERQLADVVQSMAQNEGRRALVLRAPNNGIVSTLLFEPGQMVSAGQPLLSILPAGAILQAQLLVPSRAVGFIAPGHRVVLRYRAFPYQKFGQHFGQVASVSRSALSVPEVVALTGQPLAQGQEPLYRVQVTLESQEVVTFGRAEALRAGMVLEADVLMERRSLFEWVFEPLFGISHHLRGSGA